MEKFDNEYLNTKLQEIVTKNTNFFDMMQQLIEFEKDYKNSDFYKRTKLSLNEILQPARMFYFTNTKVWSDKLNVVLNSIDSEQIVALLDKAGDILEENNNATLEQIKEFKELGGAEIIAKQQILDSMNNNNKQ